MHRLRLQPSALPAIPPQRLPGSGSDRGVWVAAGLTVLILLLADAGRVAPDPASPERSGPLRAKRPPPVLALSAPTFEAPAAAPAAAPAEAQIAALGRPPVQFRDAARGRYLKAADLYGLMHELLPDAAAGERASQYHLYLILGQCQTWLRLDPDSARALNERVMLALNDRPADERLQWQSEYQRCRGFAGGDLDPLRTAMGTDTPGSEVEYASIWFQRAAGAGYPPALAEAALRINLMLAHERETLLEEATLSGDPDVFWQLFLNSPGEGADPVSPAGMAWLILACRGGHDCSGSAEWFRGAVCPQEGAGCSPGESAIEHFWYSLTEADRAAAFALSTRLQRDLADGRVDRLPWPVLANRNIYENRFAQAGAGQLTGSIR